MNTIKAGQFKFQQNVVLLAGGAAFVVVGFIGWQVYKKIRDFNKGTPYEGAGVIGTLGNATDKVLGGAPSAVGGAVGRALYDWFHPVEADSMITYTFDIEGAPYTFADGKVLSRGAVNAEDVDGKGYFHYHGERMRLRQDSSGKRVAVPATEIKVRAV
jgi:hypothetical protein